MASWLRRCPYGEAAPKRWAAPHRPVGSVPTDGRILGSGAPGASEAFAYIDSDAKVHAPFDAMALAERLGIQNLHKPM